LTPDVNKSIEDWFRRVCHDGNFSTLIPSNSSIRES
jgi:hypothetical protein